MWAYCVCCSEVDTQTTCPGAQQKDKNIRPERGGGREGGREG